MERGRNRRGGGSGETEAGRAGGGAVGKRDGDGGEELLLLLLRDTPELRLEVPVPVRPPPELHDREDSGSVAAVIIDDEGDCEELRVRGPAERRDARRRGRRGCRRQRAKAAVAEPVALKERHRAAFALLFLFSLSSFSFFDSDKQVPAVGLPGRGAGRPSTRSPTAVSRRRWFRCGAGRPPRKRGSGRWLAHPLVPIPPATPLAPRNVADVGGGGGAPSASPSSDAASQVRTTKGAERRAPAAAAASAGPRDRRKGGAVPRHEIETSSGARRRRGEIPPPAAVAPSSSSSSEASPRLLAGAAASASSAATSLAGTGNGVPLAELDVGEGLPGREREHQEPAARGDRRQRDGAAVPGAAVALGDRRGDRGRRGAAPALSHGRGGEPRCDAADLLDVAVGGADEGEAPGNRGREAGVDLR